MKYQERLRIVVRHDFYADGNCPDVALVPTDTTRRLLRNHRALFKSLRHGGRILEVQTPQGGALLPLAAPQILRFHLQVESPDFWHFTDLAALRRWPVPRLTTRGVTTPVSVLRVDSSDSTRLPTGVVAEVEVEMADLAPVVEIRFQAAHFPWTYYCLTDLPADRQLTLFDAAYRPPVPFGAATRRSLDEDPDPSDPVGCDLAQRHRGDRLIRFVSEQPVACREVPDERLELRLDGERLLGPLPAPSVRRRVRLGGAQPFDSLYQVVRYRNQPFLKKGA